MFLALANLVVVQYGRGALRSALDQGARVGSVSSSEEECRQRVEDVLGQLLGGRMGDSIVASCAVGSRDRDSVWQRRVRLMDTVHS